jgi:uncharacterized protein
VADERETLTYELFGAAARALARQVADDGFEPDLVLAIARGGLFRWCCRRCSTAST